LPTGCQPYTGTPTGVEPHFAVDFIWHLVQLAARGAVLVHPLLLQEPVHELLQCVLTTDMCGGHHRRAATSYPEGPEGPQKRCCIKCSPAAVPNYSSIPCRAMQPAKQALCLHFVPLWPQAPSCCYNTSRGCCHEAPGAAGCGLHGCCCSSGDLLGVRL
jgi:hypothetical protein